MKTLKLLTFIVSIAFISCTNTKPKTTVDFKTENEAQWLTDEMKLPTSDSLFYLENPAPLFRKEFNADKPVENATLIITAAGYYKATLNGEQVGKNELDPAWTDFSKRIYFSEYDVTSMLTEGENCLGVKIGNGFYNPLPLRKWGRRNLRNDLAKVGKPTFIAKLHIEYKNGSTEEIISDTSWKYAYGPVMKNDAYLGVAYDARRNITGWNKAGFKDNDWKPVVIGEAPGGELQKAVSPPVQITKKITPVAIASPEEGIYVVDMGVNFTGTYRIKLAGNIGDTITFRFGERIFEDGNLNPMTTVIGQIKHKGVGGPGAPEIAWQTDSYIIGSEKAAWFQPEFTYHTYRYMEISGLNTLPEISDIEGLFLHSNVENKNSFTCSSELLNSIQEITERTFKANLVSVQSDCPAREKFGYGGDLNATSESFIYNFDMQGFYRKTIYDWVDAMRDSMFVDTAPFTGVKYCGISWESAYLLTQYYLYLYYNDTDLVNELYEKNVEWMNKVAYLHPDGLVDNGLGDHESMIRVPVQLTGTCHYLQCARIMQTFAKEMKDTANEEKYGQLAEKLKGIIKAEFWDKPVTFKLNKQTLFAALLYHEIIPENEIEAAKDSLKLAIKNGPAEHLSTGIFGTKYALEALSQNVSPNAVFDIVNSTEYPGWGFMVDNGATTVWETWEESDNTFSNCHPMFGTVTEWFYRWLAGIRPLSEKPGFEEFILAPSTPDGLDFVNCTYHSPFGEIVSNWKKDGSGNCSYEMEIPEGSTAVVSLPLSKSQRISSVKKDGGAYEITDAAKFELSKGKYEITVSE
jgi:alpha-L-rhamnosidase